jgi:hypothetical protein
MISGTTKEPVALPDATSRRLLVFNLSMAALHATQGVAMLLLSTDFALPVRTSFLGESTGPGQGVTDINTLFDLRLGPLVASFLFVSAIAHLAVSLPRLHGWYMRNLARGMNPARWYEYAISASIMIVAIAMLTGIFDIAMLLLLFSTNAAMIFFGLIMEQENEGRDDVRWTPYVLGCIVGAVPWIVIGLFLSAPGSRDPGDVPGFVYGIFVSLFVFFNAFAVNMFLQYRRIGPWKRYLFGEYGYIVLSLTAKSALAWQVFAGTLR